MSIRKNAILALGISALLVSGCSSNTLKKSRNVSASGIAYTDNVNELLDETIKKVIDFDSRELLKTRIGSNPKKMLQDKNKALSSLIAEINHFRYQTSLMKNYFINLQALADSTIKDDIGASVGTISGSISHLNNRSNKSDNVSKHYINEEQQSYIGSLTGMLLSAHYAANMEATLKRDAPIIGTQLLLQEKQLNHILSILRDRLSTGNALFLNEKVIAPYINKEVPIADKEMWISSRYEWFKMREVTPIFSKVKEAHKALRLAWEDILRGKEDIDATSTMLADVSEFVATLHHLDKARKETTALKTN
jgi:hypothetical protein